MNQNSRNSVYGEIAQILGVVLIVAGVIGCPILGGIIKSIRIGFSGQVSEGYNWTLAVCGAVSGIVSGILFLVLGVIVESLEIANRNIAALKDEIHRKENSTAAKTTDRKSHDVSPADNAHVTEPVEVINENPESELSEPVNEQEHCFRELENARTRAVDLKIRWKALNADNFMLERAINENEAKISKLKKGTSRIHASASYNNSLIEELIRENVERKTTLSQKKEEESAIKEKLTEAEALERSLQEKYEQFCKE